MAAPYSLKIMTPVILGSSQFVTDVTREASDWRRSVRLQGGYWQGSFTLRGSLGFLTACFYNWLGYHVEERAGGGKSWEGMIWSLDFNNGGRVRRRAYDFIENALRATYISDVSAVTTTGYTTQAKSLTRYGRKENTITLDGYPAAAVTDRINRELNLNAWPWARLVGAGQPEYSLTVNVVGYVFALNFRYVTAADGTTGNVSTWVNSILTTDGADFVSVGNVSANTLQAAQVLPMPTRAWDKVLELTLLGDASYNPWQFYVDNGRYAYYKQLSFTPRYYQRGQQFFNAAGVSQNTQPRLMRPAVVRDMDYPVSLADTGSPYADSRDYLIEELSVNANDDLSFSTSEITESSLMTVQAKAGIYNV